MRNVEWQKNYSVREFTAQRKDSQRALKSCCCTFGMVFKNAGNQNIEQKPQPLFSACSRKIGKYLPSLALFSA
jgi:hypothetical protein